MVLKQMRTYKITENEFESDVISDGTQTAAGLRVRADAFESDVISDGTQTIR